MPSNQWRVVSCFIGCLHLTTFPHLIGVVIWNCYVASRTECTHDVRPDVKLPTQIVLVDWLRCLRSAYRDLHGPDKPLRVAVVLSAWDMAPKEAKANDPDAISAPRAAPIARFSVYEHIVFPVTDIRSECCRWRPCECSLHFKTKYLDGDPNVAGFVAFSSCGKLLESKDLTLPLAWAFGCHIDDVMDQQGRSQ